MNCIFCANEVILKGENFCCDRFKQIAEFRNEQKNEIEISSLTSSQFTEEEFLLNACDILSEAGTSGDCTPAFFNNPNLGIRVDGHSFSEIDGTLSIFIVECQQEEWVNPMPESEVMKFISRASRFIEKSLNERFRSGLEETDSGFEASEFINDATQFEKFSKIRIIFITDGLFSKRVREIKSAPIADKRVVCEAWDLTRLLELKDSELETESFEIDFQKYNGGLNTLSADVHGSESYLVVMPGTVLSDIYDEYGQRLLESNVRTFLDFRSNVNKGLRDTLRDEPDKFFAYNNGLTATATGIKTINNSGIKITSLENLQIVNGGQTTSAIYFAPREKNYTTIDLSKIFVQMKLSIISTEEEFDEDIEDFDPEPDFKSRIAEYANTQNKVNSDDFTSNHPYQVSLDRYSKRTLTRPNEEGIQTKWFYERVRGQYLTTKRQRKTDSKKKEFDRQFPRSQLFNKTDLAKFENSWRMNPNVVSKGASKNFKAIWTVLAKEFEKKPEEFRDNYFKDIVAKTILFKSTDKIIFSADWYKQAPGMKAQAVTYTVSLLRYLLKKQGKEINLSNIWDNQALSDSLTKEIYHLASSIKSNIDDQSFRVIGSVEVANAGEWCKMEACWEKFKEMDWEFNYIKQTDTLNEEELKDKKVVDGQSSEASQAIESIEGLLLIKVSKWLALIDFQRNAGFSDNDKEISFINLIIAMHKPPHRVPSDAQQKGLYKVYNTAIENGFYFED